MMMPMIPILMSRVLSLQRRGALYVIECKLDEIIDNVDNMKESVKDICHLNEKLKLSVGIYHTVREAFQCKMFEYANKTACSYFEMLQGGWV